MSELKHVEVDRNDKYIESREARKSQSGRSMGITRNGVALEFYKVYTLVKVGK